MEGYFGESERVEGKERLEGVVVAWVLEMNGTNDEDEKFVRVLGATPNIVFVCACHSHRLTECGEGCRGEG